MNSIHLDSPTDKDIKSMFAFLQQNPKVFEEYLKMKKTRKILNNKAPQNNTLINIVNSKIKNNSVLSIYLDNEDGDCPKVNLNFQTSAGIKHKVIAPNNIQLKDLFKKYIQRLGLEENVLDKDIFFISNALRMNANETRTLHEMKIFDNHLILVMDSRNLVGA